MTAYLRYAAGQVLINESLAQRTSMLQLLIYASCALFVCDPISQRPKLTRFKPSGSSSTLLNRDFTAKALSGSQSTLRFGQRKENVRHLAVA